MQRVGEPLQARQHRCHAEGVERDCTGAHGGRSCRADAGAQQLMRKRVEADDGARDAEGREEDVGQEEREVVGSV